MALGNPSALGVAGSKGTSFSTYPPPPPFFFYIKLKNPFIEYTDIPSSTKQKAMHTLKRHLKTSCISMQKGGPGISVLLAQGGCRYLCLPLARDAQPHPAPALPRAATSPWLGTSGTSSKGPCITFSSGLKWKHFKGLCLPPPRRKQLITSLKGSSSLLPSPEV